MRAEVTPTHDARNFYLRWEIVPEGRERALLEGLGGPLVLEIETSCYFDLAGNRHEKAAVKVAVWPHAGPRNLGQARFSDSDARRRFWTNLQSAVGTTVVDYLHEAKPGSVGKEGATIKVREAASA